MTEPTPVTARITDDDRAHARKLLTSTRWVGPGSPPRSHAELADDVAQALAEARAAGYAAGLAEGQDDAHASGYREGVKAGVAVFSSLFSGEPDTPCRTTWRREAGWSLPGVDVPLTECVEVPLDELQATFDEAERLAEGRA